MKIVVFFLAIQSLVFANEIFMPKNNLKVAIDSKIRNDMTEVEFNKIIDRVESVYAPIVKSKKAVLVFSRNWSDDTVNASANRFGGTAWFVNMYGGLARHQLVTNDGFLLVICHELGHHLGGTPTKGGINGFWASTEGQADYFGSLKCMRRILVNDDNISIIKNLNIEPVLEEKCRLTYKSENEMALCQRIGMAGFSLAQLLASLGESSAISFETPDLSVVKKSNPNHPAAQCRLDTYLSADLCTISYNEDVDKNNPNAGACTKKNGFSIGNRPLCWYKPTRQELWH